MAKQQQQPTIPRFVAIPGEPEDTSAFYDRIAKEKSAANLARSAAIPTLSQVFTEKRVLEVEHEEQARQEQLAQLQANPGWSLTMLPRSDPLAVESRRKLLNHE